jgi:hypothetical protein
MGEAAACLCAVLLFTTSLFHQYATEGRAYTLMVAFLAFAMVCYQRVPARGWVALLGLSLILAGASHYYAVFAMIPFFLAEGVFVMGRRRIRWPVWLALFAGVLPLLFSWRVLLNMKNYYGPHMFSRPILYEVRDYYRLFFLLRSDADTAIGVGIALLAAAAILWRVYEAWQNNADPAVAEFEPVTEGALLLGLIGLPYFVFFAAVLLHGSILGRYVLGSILGIVVGLGIAVSLAGRRAMALLAIFLLFSLGFREVLFWRHPLQESFNPYTAARSVQELADVKEEIERAGHPELSVVMSDCLLYSQVAYYLEPRFTGRLLYLADAQRDLKYYGDETNFKAMTALREFFPVHVADYSEFTANHPEFLLYSAGLDWDTLTLVEEGYSLELLSTKTGAAVYLVKRKSVQRPE